MDEIKTVSCDWETYSEADLSKCGVYRYAEDPSFEILLAGISVNEQPPVTYDLACGEKIPDEILRAIVSKRAVVYSFNAAFERVCLSVYLRRNYPDLFKGYGGPDDSVGRYLDPVNWRCDMILAAYNGLPLSLSAVGAVLGFEKQKLSEGKDLVKYFSTPCKPTQSNGGRTRNRPADAPDKWMLFKKYNVRDVEVQLQIHERLAKYPVPDSVWEEWFIDQKINDRGIRIDRKLVNEAIRIDGLVKDDLTEKMERITGLDNPNSVMQLKGWLAENGIVTDALGKKDVKELLKTASGPAKEVLEMRQQLAKSSVKKYTAMLTSADPDDDRCRGLFQFYGANRTGRWCLTGDHEILTPTGWQRLDEWTGGLIACWNASTEAVSFQNAEALHFPYKGPMYTYKDGRIDQCSTPDHKMRAKRRPECEWQDMTVAEMSKCRPSIPMTGYHYHRGCANPAWLRVLIMTQADGYYTPDGSVRFHFKKHRKIERCKQLLRRAEIPFVIHKCKDTTIITIPARAVPLWLREFRTKTFGYWLLDENPDIFFDELPNWDGYYPAPNSVQYCTCNKQNADIVQALAHMSGRCAVMRVKKRQNEKWSEAYVLDIWLTPGSAHEIRCKPAVEEFSGTVYCASTPTGYFLVRRGGKVWVTGNSGRRVQLQNLPQNHMPDLDAARTLVRDGDFETLELLYDNIPQVLSELIRTAFIPRESVGGKPAKFIVSDMSSIEARVLAYLAGEQWKMDAFARGEDIYCSTASRMFHKPVIKHGLNGELRAKGKIAELACGYGGSTGALKAMGALDMGLAEDELPGIVSTWRDANSGIVDYWWKIDTAVKKAIRYHMQQKVGSTEFFWKSGVLFIRLPSGRTLSYIKPRIGTNRFGGESVTYMGLDQQKHWNRLESYGPKFCENIVQGFARDVLCFAMRNLKDMNIVGHVHDELIIECPADMKVNEISDVMGMTPPWAPGLLLRAEGYECPYYQKS